MNYCISYNRDSKYLKESQEIAINLDKIEQIEKLGHFINDHCHQRTIVRIDFNFFFQHKKVIKEKMRYLAPLNPYFAIELINSDYDAVTGEMLDFLKSFRHYIFFDAIVHDLLKFLAIIYRFDRLITDVVIGGELGFYLKELKTINIRPCYFIRAYPNVMETTEDNVLKNFFIRPEDVKSYEGYIDVLDFRYCYNKIGRIVTDTFYRIYQSGEWDGDLKELYPCMSESIYNPLISNNFALRRLNCQRKCQTCDYCERVLKKCNQVNHMTDLLKEGFELCAEVKELLEDEDKV